MDTSYFRNLFNLHRKETLLARSCHLALWLFLGILGSSNAYAQNTRYRRIYLEDYEDRSVRYGFFFAAPVTRFNIKYNATYVSSDSAYQLYSPNKISFRVGFVVNAILNEHLDLRLTPAVSLYGRSVEYRFPNTPSKTELRESTWLELPLLVKYKSTRRRNSRMYVVGGLSLGIETNVRRREVQGTSRLLTKTTDLTVEYGIGFEQFFEFFKFAPELRFSHGLSNLYEPVQNASFNRGIQRLNTHTVSLYLTFE